MREDEIFLRRTDQLAIQMRQNVDDLADVLGVSRASLYGYRKGQRKISSKAWLKLEDAERRAGVTAASAAQSQRLAAAAEEAGGTEEERQARFDEMMDREKMPWVEEMNRLREEVKLLLEKLAAARKALE